MDDAFDRARRAHSASVASSREAIAASKRLSEALDTSSGVPVKELEDDDSLVVAMEAKRRQGIAHPRTITRPRVRAIR